MTREEAIVLLKVMFAFWANTHEQTNVEMEMALNLTLTALRPVTREQVEVIRGEWIEYEYPHIICCTQCDYGTGPNEKTRFCPYCGAPMTDEAVDMMLERLEALE